MNQNDLQTILRMHKEWLTCGDGKRAVLQGADLQGADLRGAYLQGAVLRGAYLRGAYLQGADLRGADLQGAGLQGADLRGAYLQGAVLRGAYLRGADLDYSFKRKIVSQKLLMDRMFQHTKNFWIVYKSFGDTYTSPKKWSIKEKSVIKEKLDTDRFNDCSFGINVATLDWCKNNCNNQIYMLIVLKTAEICVPVWTDGKVRVSEAKIIKEIN